MTGVKVGLWLIEHGGLVVIALLLWALLELRAARKEAKRQPREEQIARHLETRL